MFIAFLATFEIYSHRKKKKFLSISFGKQQTVTIEISFRFCQFSFYTSYYQEQLPKRPR